MVQRGEVSLNDPVSKYLPEGVKVPERNGRAITLVDLATHTPGLPRLPGNLRPKDPANPYADYSSDSYSSPSRPTICPVISDPIRVFESRRWLARVRPGRRAGTDYESLVHSRIAGPLGMKSTGIALSPEMKDRLATGHDDKLHRFLIGICQRWPGRERSLDGERPCDFPGRQSGLSRDASAFGDDGDARGTAPDRLAQSGRGGLGWLIQSPLITRSSGITAERAVTDPSSGSTPGRESELSCSRTPSPRQALMTSACISWTPMYP